MQEPFIHFFFQKLRFTLRDRRRLRAFIKQLFKKEHKQLQSLQVIFCTDKALLKMNRDFLKHNYYTDIITFPLSPAGMPVEAELYISIERVRDNANNLGTAFQTELHRVIFHGCLHLCGYADKSSQQIKKMREREDHYLRLYFRKASR